MSSRPGPIGQRIATELRAELARQNRSRRWLAEQIGQPHNTVNRWLMGESSPGVDNVDAMCRALGFTVADLIVAVQVEQEDGPIPQQHRRRSGDRFRWVAAAA
jgi:transcriptional regulator with XRE-family HTH domain